MKKLIPVLLLLLGSLSTMGQTNPYQGKKPLETVVLSGIPCKEGQPLESTVFLQVMEFDKAGNLAEWVDYEQENIVEFKANSGSKLLFMLPQDSTDYKRRSQYTYDGNGNAVEVSTLTAQGRKSIVKHTYDTKNRKKKSEGFSAQEEPIYSTTYAYSDFDSLVSMETKTAKGVLKFIQQYTYNADHRLERETKMGKGDRFIYDYAYEYDDAGHRTAIISVGEDGNPISAQSFVYDPDGHLISHKHSFYFEGKEAYSTQTDYVFNEDGQKVTEIYFDRRGKLHSKYQHKYDKAGLLSETQFQDAKGKTWETIRYTYLKDGSPVKKEVSNGRGQLIDIYQYQYTFRE